MFICEGPDCTKVVIGPRISPIIKVVATRAASYECTKRDEEGDLIPALTFGEEIVKEVKLCAECAGVEIREPIFGIGPELRQKMTVVRGPADGKGDHRNGCKSPLHECFVCQRYIEMAQEIPLPILSELLEQPMPSHWKSMPMGALLVHSVKERSNHNSKRAERDLQATYAVVGPSSRRGVRI